MSNDLLENVKANLTPDALKLIASYKDAGPELKDFMVPLILTFGADYAKRYIQTELSNRQRFAPLIAEFLAAYRANDDMQVMEKAFALTDLAESIWAADA